MDEINLERIDGIFEVRLFLFGKIFLLIAHGALDRSWFASIPCTSKQVNVKQESANFYDSRSAHLMFSRMPKSSCIQAGTVTEEGYNTSAIKCFDGTNRGVRTFSIRLCN